MHCPEVFVIHDFYRHLRFLEGLCPWPLMLRALLLLLFWIIPAEVIVFLTFLTDACYGNAEEIHF